MEKEIEFKCMSRKELSFVSNVPLTTINRAIERDSKVFAEDALRIAKALDVSVLSLLDMADYPAAYADASDAGIDLCLCKKYYSVIKALDMIPEYIRRPLCRMIEDIK